MEKILWAHNPKNLEGQKRQIWSDFEQLSTLTANILRIGRDIQNWKQTLLTAITAGFDKKLVSFGPQTRKLQVWMLTYLSSEFGTISSKFWPRMSLERIDVPKIDNELDRLPFFSRWTKNWWTLVHRQNSYIWHVDPIYVDIVCSTYANAFEFEPRDFATGGISPFWIFFRNRTYGAGQTHIGLCTKFLFFYMW